MPSQDAVATRPARGPGDRHHALVVPSGVVQRLACGRVPEVDHAPGRGGGGQRSAIRGQGQGPDARRQERQLPELPACCPIPQADLLVLARNRQQPALARKGQAHSGAAQRADLLPGGHVPEDRFACADPRGGQGRSVRRESNRLNAPPPARSVCKGLPPATGHSRTPPSPQAAATLRPSGEKASAEHPTLLASRLPQELTAAGVPDAQSARVPRGQQLAVGGEGDRPQPPVVLARQTGQTPDFLARGDVPNADVRFREANSRDQFTVR